jgi:hypothetical protein
VGFLAQPRNACPRQPAARQRTEDEHHGDRDQDGTQRVEQLIQEDWQRLWRAAVGGTSQRRPWHDAQRGGAAAARHASCRCRTSIAAAFISSSVTSSWCPFLTSCAALRQTDRRVAARLAAAARPSAAPRARGAAPV